MAKLSVVKALAQAGDHNKRGDVQKAEQLYKEILRVFPQNKKAQQGLAALNRLPRSNVSLGPPQAAINQLIAFYNQGQLEIVSEKANKLAKQYPGAFMVWNILGAANKGLGRVQAAATAFKKVTSLNPTYAEGFSNLGVTLQDQGELDEALSSFTKAISLKPDYAEA